MPILVHIVPLYSLIQLCISGIGTKHNPGFALRDGCIIFYSRRQMIYNTRNPFDIDKETFKASTPSEATMKYVVY